MSAVMEQARLMVAEKPRGVRFHLDKTLMLVSVTLLLFGFVMMTSASLHLGEKMVGEAFYYPLRQLIHISLGLAIAGAVFFIPLQFWEKTGQWLFIAGLVLLLLVLIPGLGAKVNGSVRWLAIGGFRLQVAEMIKLISLIYTAGYLVRHTDTVQTSVKGMIRPLFLMAFACGLLLQQPDFGSAAVIVMCALLMMFLAGARLWQFVLLGLFLALTAVLLVIISPYRMQRVTAFMNPWEDPLGSGYQLTQSLIALGTGEWSGVGLGGGVQKLFYLPEGHTDFLFAVIGEELGFMGSVTVIVLFGLFIWRAFRTGLKAEKMGNQFSAFLAYGIGIWFALQAFINIGVNMGALPTKGLTLPLMSYGGSSMIIMCVAVALLQRVHHEASCNKEGGLQT
ncbi:MAG: putative lipid II flippase FtsW [Gammaproteobacteria bacterium]|nr:MAG: putative lipid II flippase FtsW [Gammaproteobacteria bacterium]